MNHPILYALRGIFLLGLVLLMVCPGKTQPLQKRSAKSLSLSLQDAVQRAQTVNWDVEQQVKESEAAKAQYRSTNALFLPSITLSETFTSTNDPVNVFSFKLKQQQFTQADFQLNNLNAPDAFENYNTRIEVMQPIINTDDWGNRKAADYAAEAQAQMARRTKQEITFTVKQWYFRAGLAQERIHVTETALRTAEENAKRVEDSFEEGLVQQADVLAAQVRVLELKSSLEEARNDYHNVEEFLSFLLRLEQGTSVSTTDSLRYFELPTLLSQDLTITEARSDLKAGKNRVKATRQKLGASKRSFIPDLNAFASYEWNDDSIFGTRADNYMIGARLSWNIFDGTRTIHTIQKARIELEQAELSYQKALNHSQLELNQAKRNAKLAFQQLETVKLARKQAQEAYRIRSDRYAEGMTSTTDLLASETKMMEQELAYLNTLYQYHTAIFRLELLLETTIYNS